MKKRLNIFLLCVTLLAFAKPAFSNSWQEISSGAFYRKYSKPFSSESIKNASPQIVHFFKFDPLVYKFDVVSSKSLGSSAFDVKTLANKSAALLAVNGGYFTPEYLPLGLLVSQGKELNKIKMVGWWHIFQIKSGQPDIITKQEYALSPEVEMAIEAGPRLLIDGKIAGGLKDSRAERTAIGTTKDGFVMIAVTDSFPLSMKEFGLIVKNVGGFNVLNLDGGSSTQLFAKIKDFSLHRPGFGPVANGVVVKNR